MDLLFKENFYTYEMLILTLFASPGEVIFSLGRLEVRIGLRSSGGTPIVQEGCGQVNSRLHC
jgi:hypothetical protein